jgi:hypothetical protein
MKLALRTCRYEIRRGGEVVALEEETLAENRIVGVRRPPERPDVYEVEADLNPDGTIGRVSVRYSRGPFVRNAIYEAADDFLRGNVSALAGRNVITTKLGRYREIDADLVIFRALTIAHIRARGQTRWTGRVAAIDSSTLVATTNKQSCRRAGDDSHKWIYEPRMGDVEEIEIDDEGIVVERRDNRGTVARLVRD